MPSRLTRFGTSWPTRLEPVHNNYFGSNIPMMRMPAFWSDCMTAEQLHTGFCGLTPKNISLDGWKNRHDLPWDQPFRYRDLECEATPTGPAGQQVFMQYVIWGLKHLLAETDYYRDFLSGMISTAVGVFHSPFCQPRTSARLCSSVSLGTKDGKRVLPLSF